MEANWISVKDRLPEENEVVNTKINVGHCKNEQPLKRKGNLWFFADGSMYVYYTPQYWQPLTNH